MTNSPPDYDSPWKEALGEYLRECLALLFPEVHAGVDWSHPYEFLDGELQQVVRDAESGRRYADRLVQVWLPGGGNIWLLIHIEVQSRQETGFPERMYVYYYRIFDRYMHEVVSLAVLADEGLGWRPDSYEQGRWGCEMRFRYPVAKLADWRGRRDELLESDNPFATVVLAHLAAQDTRGDMAGRERVKLGLIRRLYERGYGKEQVLSLFRFINWLLELPAVAEVRIWQAIEAIEEEQKMPYVTSMERAVLEKRREEAWQEGLEAGRQAGLEAGRQEGLEAGRQAGLEAGRQEAMREAIRRVVRARFAHVPEALDARLAAADESMLDEVLARAATVASIAEL